MTPTILLTSLRLKEIYLTSRHPRNGIAKWPTCSLDIDGFCNGGDLLGMFRVESMTYFQDHKWYDELFDGKLKDETLALKANVKGSWGDVAPGVNAHEIAPFTRMENLRWGPYANMKTKKTSDPYLDVKRIFGKAINDGETQENQGHKDNPTPGPSN
nr:hypothetical protein [Tanacetum cinerariifolium]